MTAAQWFVVYRSAKVEYRLLRLLWSVVDRAWGRQHARGFAVAGAR